MLTMKERYRTDIDALPVTRSRADATDHSGMSLRTHFQPDVTVVEVCGAVDADNAQRLSDYVTDLAGVDRHLVVDSYGVNFIGREGIRALVELADKCRRIGARWFLVPSDAVSRLLHSTDDTYRIPSAASLNDALQRLASPNHAGPQRITPRKATRC